MKYSIYEGNNTKRFVLGNRGVNPLFIFGVNPSDANANRSDQTVRQIEGFIANRQKMQRENAFDGFLLFNLYPLISTDPDNLPNECSNALNQSNAKIIKQHFDSIQKPTIWAAWGDLIDSRSYLLNCLKNIVEVLKPLNTDWKKRGSLTKKGLNPRHPSRLAHADELEFFDVEDYLSRKYSAIQNLRRMN